MFEDWVQKGNEFIKEVSDEMETDRQTTFRITKVVLQALRDRLSPMEAKDLVSQLPMILKAVWCDGWNPVKTPDKSIKKKEDFIEYVFTSPELVQPNDLEDINQARKAVVSVFCVLKRHLSQGEIDDIAAQLPEDIRILWLQPKVYS